MVWLVAIYLSMTAAVIALAVFKYNLVYVICSGILLLMDCYFGFKLFSRGVFVGKKKIIIRLDDKTVNAETDKVESIKLRIYSDAASKRNKLALTLIRSNGQKIKEEWSGFSIAKSDLFAVDLSDKAIERIKEKAKTCDKITVVDELHVM